MECKRVSRLLPGYLDDALPTRRLSDSHAKIGHHLELCRECREELRRYRELSSLISRVQPRVPPKDLALRIRVAASHRLAHEDWLHYLRAFRIRVTLVLKNILQPLAVPATGGLAVALFVFVLVCQVLGVGTPLKAVTNDSPTNLLQPARLEALAPFAISGLEDLGHPGFHALLVETMVNAEGQAVAYRILEGPDNAIVRRQLDLVLLFSRFRPQMSFGRPTSGGRVVLSFSEISIKG